MSASAVPLSTSSELNYALHNKQDDEDDTTSFPSRSSGTLDLGADPKTHSFSTQNTNNTSYPHSASATAAKFHTSVIRHQYFDPTRVGADAALPCPNQGHVGPPPRCLLAIEGAPEAARSIIANVSIPPSSRVCLGPQRRAARWCGRVTMGKDGIMRVTGYALRRIYTIELGKVKDHYNS
ncbi:hypothetical protein B0H11DRAFT_1941575 [Mycena galericulata]|nr:hypothetical protein B0H11DRAFT_1941575 [Mycena galericulata]